MKKAPITFCFVFFFMFVLHGQNNPLITTTKEIDLSEKNFRIDQLTARPEHLSLEYVKLDLTSLFLSGDQVLQFDRQQYRVTQRHVNIRGADHFSWTADNLDGDGQIILSRYHDDVQATITKGNAVYRLQTIAPGQYVIIRLDQGALPPEKCNFPVAPSPEPGETPPIVPTTPNYPSGEDKHQKDNAKALTPYSCKLRLLVLYTPAARAAVGNIENTIHLAVAETNQSFINSNIPYEVELAYAGATSYTEVDIETDLNRMVVSDDSYMDEVYDLREAYAADICILINFETEFCGLARNIQVGADEAFCIVNVLCATGNFTFGHEIGHLIGCRHDTYVDGQGIPYPYGHGYVNVSEGWRTIMGYNNLCSANGTDCIRIPYWSNPAVTYLGQPTGTAAIEDCARVWNENTGIAMGFREAPDQVMVTTAAIHDLSYGDLIAKQDIQTTENLTVQEGSEVYWRAGQQITLAAGFAVEAGASFYAGTETPTDCGEPPHPNLASCGNAGNSIVFNGTVLEITAQVTNNGLSTAGNAQIGFYLSSNFTISTADFLLDTRPTGILAPGQSVFQTISVDLETIDLPDGSYYVGYVVDYLDEITESNEGDNACYWSSPTVTLPIALLPDLASCGLSGNNQNIDGNIMHLTIEVANQGTVAAGSSRVGYYLSADTEFTTADYLIGTDNVGNLDPGASSVETITIDLTTLAIPDGTYYVGFILDDQAAVTELNEGNNDCYWTIIRATLPVPALPDLNSCGNAGNNISINGSMLDATIEASNKGTATAGAFSVGLYLSTNSFISTGDYLIGSGAIGSIEVDASGFGFISVDLDGVAVPAGEYYIGYILDYLNEVQEGDEFDNWCYWVGTTINLPIANSGDTHEPISISFTETQGYQTADPEEEPPISPDPEDHSNGDNLQWGNQKLSGISAPSLRAFPNPAKTKMTLSFTLSGESAVHLTIRDLRGRTLNTLIDREVYGSGRYETPLNTTQFAPGLYFCELRTSREYQTQKIIIAK